MKLLIEMQLIADNAGGSSATRKARRGTAADLAYFANGKYGIKTFSGIKTKTIERYVEHLKNTRSDRSLQNTMSHIRVMLQRTSKSPMSMEPALSNKMLGISNASRTGTHRAITLMELEDRFSNLDTLPDVLATAQLQAALGLRSKEAVMVGRIDVLERLERELSNSNYCSIREGTKGGRARTVTLACAQYERAIIAVRKAIDMCDSDQRNHLINSKENNLKSALNRYNNAMKRAGFTGKISPHSLRYAFAQERIAAYEAEGGGKRLAREYTAQDLGHGSGRYRWINQIYAQK